MVTSAGAASLSRTPDPGTARAQGPMVRRTTGEIRTPWIRSQGISVTRHAAALRPFRAKEFGTGPAAPSEGHLQAVNALLARLRQELIAVSERVRGDAAKAIAQPSTARLQALVTSKERAHDWVRAIVVEQVLSLQASWSRDRGLLAPLDPRASFGTVLIWLSRSLEAVCESVGDLTFALDSVFVDAAQRQVIELKFPGEETLLLSDLLDWVDRASRDEGPRIIQDAGKDGVFAFAPVLRRLRDLIRKTRNAARHGHGLPDGMRTPRVDRALQVLVDQLNEATELASSVRRDAPPLIEDAHVVDHSTGMRASLAAVSRKHPSVRVDIFGTNFRPNASVVLIAQDREDLHELHTRSITVSPPSRITTTFRDPTTVHHSTGVTWLVAVTNEDGTHSNQFPLDQGKSAS